jgi:hypothetical protein
MPRRNSPALLRLPSCRQKRPATRRLGLAPVRRLDARRGDDGRPIELAEMTAEGHQRLVVEPLPAKSQDEMIGPGLLDCRDGFSRQRPGEIDTLESLPPVGAG